MRKVDDGKRNKRKEKKKRMAFLVATSSLPAVYRPNGYARMSTAGTPHACANRLRLESFGWVVLGYCLVFLWFIATSAISNAVK